MQRAHRSAHAAIWLVLAILLPISLAIILLSVSKLSPDAPAIRLDATARSEGGQP